MGKTSPSAAETLNQVCSFSGRKVLLYFGEYLKEIEGFSPSQKKKFMRHMGKIFTITNRKFSIKYKLLRLLYVFILGFSIGNFNLFCVYDV